MMDLNRCLKDTKVLKDGSVQVRHWLSFNAWVVELVYTRALGARAARIEGSNPSPGIFSSLLLGRT